MQTISSIIAKYIKRPVACVNFLDMGLVGRSAELGELAALLDRATAGFGGVITLVGTAGSGKSALAAEAAALARDRGFEVAGGSAVRGRPGRGGQGSQAVRIVRA
jgi:AAA ATPase domain